MTVRPSLACLAALSLVATGALGQDLGQPLYERVREEYWALAKDGPEGRRAAAWRRTAERFRAVAARQPPSAKADDGLYMAGICRERAYALSDAPTDREAALAAYRELFDRHRGSNLADDGLLRAGRLLEARGDMDGARRHYRRVLEDLPQGDMAPLARKRLTELGTQARLEAIRTWSGGGYTRVVLDLSRAAPFTVRNLPPNPAAAKPDRLYLDLARSRLVGDCPGCVPISDGLVRQVRAGQNTPDMVRVVLDLHGPATYRVFPLEQPSRIVIDVFRSAPQEDVIASIIGDKTRQAAPSRPLRIVIDPGHGGKDPGAVGPNGLMEKDVTLALGRELARVLEERLGCETRLTRTGDYYLGLENRTAMANAFGADLFISIHANANRSRSARGIETYYLDRPSDRAARRLAALENAGTEEGLAEVEHILTDVLLTPKINESRVLATAIQGALVARIDKEYGSTRDLGVKRGPFYVLTGAVMPSVLVETSFITHPVEAKRLGDESFQKRVAQAMADGIAAFVKGS